MDLGDLPSVKKAAEEFKRCVSDDCSAFVMNAQRLTCVVFSREKYLHVLMNNA
jgi:hypothetical protein